MARKTKEDSDVEYYTTEITYNCPNRGKVTQKVKVKKYKTAEISYLQEVKVVDLDNPEDGFQLVEDKEEE